MLNAEISSKAFNAIVRSEFTDVFILSVDDGVDAIRSGKADLLIVSGMRSNCLFFHDRVIGNEVRIQQLKKYCPDMIWEKVRIDVPLSTKSSYKRTKYGC